MSAKEKLKKALAEYEKAKSVHRLALVAFKKAVDKDDPMLRTLRTDWLAACEELERLEHEVSLLQSDPQSYKDEC